MKYVNDRPFADPEKAARKLLEIANTVEAIQRTGASISRRSTGRFCFSTRGRLRNTRLGLIAQIAPGVGLGLTD